MPLLISSQPPGPTRVSEIVGPSIAFRATVVLEGTGELYTSSSKDNKITGSTTDQWSVLTRSPSSSSLRRSSSRKRPDVSKFSPATFELTSRTFVLSMGQTSTVMA